MSKRKAARATIPGGLDTTQHSRPNNTLRSRGTQLPWRVVVDFVSRAGAAATARRLHALGMMARVEGPRT